MKICYLIAFCLVTFLCKDVGASSETNNNEVKAGAFPYMAYVFYSDETLRENGTRFVRGAALIRPNWLISSAIDPVMVNNVPKGFPKKQLFARLGATTIDDDFELDEEELEQEREVMQLIRPSDHNSIFWWVTDITLLKTIMPFSNISENNLPPFNYKRDFIDRKCFILIFAKKSGNATEDRMLMKLAVEFLPPTSKNCGPLFNESTMACGVDVDEGDPVFEPSFCTSNRGSPLICDKELTGLQTYIDDRCKQPFLYQLIVNWNKFINCGIHENCLDSSCANTCTVVNKDDTFGEYEGYLVNTDLVPAAANVNTAIVLSGSQTATTIKPVGKAEAADNNKEVSATAAEGAPSETSAEETKKTENLTEKLDVEMMSASAINETILPHRRENESGTESGNSTDCSSDAEKKKETLKPRKSSSEAIHTCIIHLFLALLVLVCVVV